MTTKARAGALACALAVGCSSTAGKSGQGTGAALAFSPANYSFGTVTIGSSSSTQSFTVRNGGASAVTGVFLALKDGTQFTVSASTCGTPAAPVAIAAGGTCTFEAVFAPTAPGPQSDALDVSFDVGAGPEQTLSASLSGTGQAAVASLTVAPASHDFGDVAVGTASPPFAFTVTNFGASAATNVYPALAAGSQFSISGGNCGGAGSKVSIPAGGSCTFDVAFSPSGFGAAYDTVTVTFDSSAAPGLTRTVAVSGTGLTTAAALAFSPPGYAFPNVTVGGSSAPQTFTVTNTGSPTASNVYLTIASGTQFSVSASTCGTAGAKVSIPGGGSCSFAVTFAPGSAGAQSDTVTVTYDAGGATGQTATAALSGTGLSGTTVTHGLTIPGTHPRLWYDAGRLAAAKTWYASHPFTPSGNMWSGAGYIDNATRGLLNSEASQCQTALTWALGAVSSLPIPTSGVACDDCRWFGEQIILTYDFCFDQMTAAQRASFVAATNGWVEHWRTQSWGGVPMHQNNYYWGYLRNELEWAITSYEDNTTEAETLLDDVLTKRLGGDFDPATTGDSQGGVGQEGSQYGPYLSYYAAVPFATAGLLGRDLLAETNFWREAVYAYVYNTTPAATAKVGLSGTGYAFFPADDDEGWTSGFDTGGDTTANFMATAAMRWSGFNVGGHARQWLGMTGARADYFVQSVDPGGAAVPFGNLPPDYYAPGPRYLWGRNVWSPSSTAFLLQLGDRDTSLLGHSHVDWGTWQIWRNGRFLSRESVGYGDSIAGYKGSGSVGVDMALAHNSVLVNGAGPSSSPWSSGTAVVRRLESQPGYSYSDVDLTPASGNFVHLEREFVFVRGLETMVILDRVQTGSATDVKTFLAHCETSPATGAAGATCTDGTQALAMTTLVPASPTYRVVTEGGVGQYRIEVDTAPGTAQSYILTVLQAKDAAAASLSPSVVDNGSSYTVALDGSTSITFQKGMVSAGGSITAGGVTTPFRADVQPIAVTDDGPAWQ